MITWIDLFGKLIQFLAEKLLDKTIDPVLLNEKKRACKSFIDFYEAISSLEVLVNEILNMLEAKIREDKIQFTKEWIEQISKKIDNASVKFISSFQNLYSVVSLYDPALGQLISNVAMGKKAVVKSLSTFTDNMVFKLEGDTASPVLRFTSPADNLQGIDFNEYYKEIRKPQVKWQKDILSDIVMKGFHEQQIELTNQYEVLKLTNEIRNHLSSLRQAKEGLGEFIKTEFTIEDLLHYSTK